MPQSPLQAREEAMLRAAASALSADQIRKELSRLAQVRTGLESDLEQARKYQAALLRQVQETEGISMTEAAEIIGVSRVMAYKMLLEG